MKYKPQFNTDVEKLKKLKLYDKEKYKVEFEKVMNKYKISRATLYRHIDKPIPGMSKERNDKGLERKPVPRKVKQAVTELMRAGKTKKAAVKTAEAELGVKISDRKANEMEAVEYDETVFSSEVRNLVERVLKVDKMAPDAGVYIKINGISVKLTKDYINDIVLIVSTAYNEMLGAVDTGKKEVDRDEMTRSQLFHLLQEAMRIVKEKKEFGMLKTLTQIRKNLIEQEKELNPNLKVFLAAMKELKPDITKSECFAIIRRHSNEEK